MQTNGNGGAPGQTGGNRQERGPGRAILALEGALRPGGAAVLEGGQVVARAEVPARRSGRTDLFAAAARVLEDRRLSPRDVGTIAVGTGPGSFTGLRVVLGLAAGVAAGLPVRPRFLAAGSAALILRAADLEPPALAAIPWGRHRVLLATGASGQRPIVTMRDELPDRDDLAGRTIAVPADLHAARWPADVRTVAARLGGLDALCALVVERRATRTGHEVPGPSYIAPPDAVLPAAPRGGVDAGPVVRLAAADAADVAALERACLPRPWSEAAVLEKLAGSGPRFAIGVRDDHGVLLAAAFARELSGALEIVRVAVAPAARRLGFGRALVLALLDEARDRGLPRADLEVRASDDAAVALHARAGFVPVGRRRDHYGPGDDALLMSAVLARA